MLRTSNPLRLACAALVASWAAAASAGNVTVTSDAAFYAPGATATFTVSDSNPRDMWTAGIAAGDFSLNYDPAALTFQSIAYPAWITNALSTFVDDNNDPPLSQPSGAVLVSLIGVDELELPAVQDELFRVSFLVNAGFGVTPVQLTGGDAPSYDFQDYTVRITEAVPEPSTYALLGLGLVAAGVASRRRGRAAS